MSLRRPRWLSGARSIRAALIALLVSGIIILLGIDSWNDYRTLSEVTQEAYDNALLEPARVLESSLELSLQGDIIIAAPLYAQAMLESRAGLRKYFSIETFAPPGTSVDSPTGERGRLLSGLPDLPRPPESLPLTGRPVFYNAAYRGDDVRIVALARDIYRAGQHRQVIVTVAESIGMRERVETAAQRREISRDLRMLALVVALVWWGVAWAMSPLTRLRNDIRSRSPDDLTPLTAGDVPVEVVPLVEAVNYHIERHRRMLDDQSRFLADASHQLRTPLAIMSTQAQYALRAKDPASAREGLAAVVERLALTRRLTEQLLSLAHASQRQAAPRNPHDMRHLARQVVLQYLPLAREKSQDLGLQDDLADETATALVNEAEIHEALSNLVHNAIHYAPLGATITVSTALEPGFVCTAVTDNGPGLPKALRERAFERFDRAGASPRPDSGGGSGLGLAIARAYARSNGGDVVLADGEPNADNGKGLSAILKTPRT